MSCTNGTHRIVDITQYCLDCNTPLYALCDGRAYAVQPPSGPAYMQEIITAEQDVRGLDARPGRIIETHLRAEDLAAE